MKERQPNHGQKQEGLRDQSPRVVPNWQDTAGATKIAFEGQLVRETWRQVRSPLPFIRRRQTRRVLAAYDGLAGGVTHDRQTTQTEQAQVIAARLEEPKAALVEEARGWEPIHARHAVLEAVSSSADSGKFYLNLFLKRTGLTSEEITRIREEVPSSRETMKVLSEDQRFAAEAVCARLLVKYCEQVAEDPDKMQDQLLSKSDKWRAVGGLIKAHVRLQQKQEGETPSEQYYDYLANEMLPHLEEGRDKIFDKAQLWDKKDLRRKVKAAARDFRKLEDSGLLEELTGITPEMVKEAKQRGISELLVTSGLAVGNELLSHAPGVDAVAQFNIQDHLPHNPWILGSATAILYGALGGALVKTSFSSANLLTKTGVGLDPWSKLKYDYAIDNEKREAVKGALKYHFLWELPFYGLALGIGAKYGWEAGLAYFNTASVAGIVKNILLNGGVETYHMMQNTKQRQKELNSFLPK